MRFLLITSKLLPLLSSTIDSKIPPPSDWTTSECTFAIIFRAREKQYKEKFFRGSFVRIINIDSQLLCRVFFFFFFSAQARKRASAFGVKPDLSREDVVRILLAHWWGGVGNEGRVLQQCGVPKRYPKLEKREPRKVVPSTFLGRGKKITIKKIPALTCRLHRTMTPPTLAANQPNPEVDYVKERSSRPNNKLTRLRPIHSSNHFNGVTRSWRHSVCPLSCINRLSEQALNDNANMLK